MPRVKGGTVAPHSEIYIRFQREGIAGQIMATLRYADKTPEQLITALGINRWGAKAKQVQWKELCKHMDELIAQDNLPIVKLTGAQIKYARSDCDRYS